MFRPLAHDKGRNKEIDKKKHRKRVKKRKQQTNKTETVK